MHTISKLVALAVLAAGTAMISASAPSQAQTERQAIPNNNGLPGAALVCCTPAQRSVITNASWTVTPPGGSAMNAVAVTNPNPGWHATLQGAQWIANVANAGLGSHPGGPYVYRMTFCLCALPKGVTAIPAAMNLTIASDNSFTAKLNTTPIGSGGPTSFITPVPITVPASAFLSGQSNVLEITVTNLPGSPTGLAVWGYVSGYFGQVLGGHCV